MAVRSSAVIEPRFRSDFWKFWTGQTISTLGSSFTSFALPLLIDAVSFLVSAGFLVLINTSFNTTPDGRKATTSLRQSIVEGLRYVLKHPILSWITLLLLLVNFILPTSSAQLVLFARQWFAASDTQIGLLYAGGSLGTVVFSLAAGRFRKRWSLGTIALGALMMEGVFTAMTSVTHWYWVLLLLWALRGGADVLFTITAYSLAQLTVPNQLLGRVITVTRVLTWSTASLGALLGGLAIERTNNVALVYALIGLLVFGIALTFFLTPLRQTERYLPKDEPS